MEWCPGAVLRNPHKSKAVEDGGTKGKARNYLTFLNGKSHRAQREMTIGEGQPNG